MSDFSETFRPIKSDYTNDQGFTHPELLHVTSGAQLYRVRKSGKFFLLKTPKKDMGMYVDLLIREYELSIGFTHPHLINVYTYEPHTPVGPAIVMEYVDGRTLSDYLKEGPTLTARIRVFEQLLSAVDCLHKADVIHNDLKPQNILISRANNDVKIIDFGLSDNSTHYIFKQLGGTRQYASPELLQQQGNVDARSDIYSIGCIMRDLFGSRYSHIRQKCLHLDPEQRYANVGQLQRAWQRRHLPQHIAVALLLSVAILLPSALYINEHQYRKELQQNALQQTQYYDSLTTNLRQQIVTAQLEISKQKNFVDSICNLYDQQLQVAYQKAQNSLNNTPYREFAFTPVTQFYRYSWDLGDEHTKSIDDASILSQLTAHFDALRNQMQKQLYDEVNKKPMLDAKQMSKEEYQYYLDLLSDQKAFEPYRP